MKTVVKFHTPKPRATTSQSQRYVLAAAVLVSIGLCGPAYADSEQMTARLAITRAQATVDLVSKENPGATQDPAFAAAQTKLLDANMAFEHHRNQQAEWLANEAELQANTTAGAAKLAGLERTRGEIAHDVDILEIELRNK